MLITNHSTLLLITAYWEIFFSVECTQWRCSFLQVRDEHKFGNKHNKVWSFPNQAQTTNWHLILICPEVPWPLRLQLWSSIHFLHHDILPIIPSLFKVAKSDFHYLIYLTDAKFPSTYELMTYNVLGLHLNSSAMTLDYTALGKRASPWLMALRYQCQSQEI